MFVLPRFHSLYEITKIFSDKHIEYNLVNFKNAWKNKAPPN